MRLTVLFVTLLPCLALGNLTFPNFNNEKCAGYDQLGEDFRDNSDKCPNYEISDDVTDCELREQLNRFMDITVCIFGGDNIDWIEADFSLNWNTIQARLKEIQVAGELEGAVEQCQGEADSVQQEDVEDLTEDIFGIDNPDDDDEQEECWDDALPDVKGYTGLDCIMDAVRQGYYDNCGP